MENNKEKKLTFDDLLKLNNKTYKVNIGKYGYIEIKRPTIADQDFAYAGSNGGDDLLKYQRLLITRIVINPQLSETQVAQLPDGIPNLIIAKVNQINNDLSEKEETENFLEK